MGEGTHQAIVSLRLHLRANRIAQVEAIVRRAEERLFDPAGMATPSAEVGEVLAPAERCSRVR